MRRKAFSLVELLVAVSIVVLLMALLGAALSSARTSGAKNKTVAAIGAIDAVLQRHFVSCESNPLPLPLPLPPLPPPPLPPPPGLAIRRIITADMPDSWVEVRYMRDNAAQFTAARQRGYVATLNAINPTDEYADAECLFMIVMQGGLADCLACTSLDSVAKGDQDNDGAPEFWDSWGQPIRYVLWPGGFELPIGVKFFANSAPFDGVSSTTAVGGTMRPLVYSWGPSKRSGAEINTDSYLLLGNACGDPADAIIAILGAFVPDLLDPTHVDNRLDNITNYDGEVKK